MATGNQGSFTLYDNQYRSGFVEVLAQALKVFNANSANCLVQRSNIHVGEYDRNTFWQDDGNVSRRDPEVTTAQTPTGFNDAERIAPKLFRKLDLRAQTSSSWRMIGGTDQEISFILGQQDAKHVLRDRLRTAIRPLVAAIKGVAAYHFDGTAGTMTNDRLIAGLSLMGDRTPDIACLVMHSKVYYNLVRNQVSDKLTGMSDLVVYGANPATYDRPTVVTDEPALISTTSAATTYYTLGLVPGAAIVEESEAMNTLMDRVGGGENIVIQKQSEWADTVKLKGFAWNIAGGGANPVDAALATTSNWTKVVADDKDTAGVLIETL